jgi:hypothetical protein
VVVAVGVAIAGQQNNRVLPLARAGCGWFRRTELQYCFLHGGHENLVQKLLRASPPLLHAHVVTGLFPVADERRLPTFQLARDGRYDVATLYVPPLIHALHKLGYVQSYPHVALAVRAYLRADGHVAEVDEHVDEAEDEGAEDSPVGGEVEPVDKGFWLLLSRALPKKDLSSSK